MYIYGLCQSNSRVSIVLCEVSSHGYQDHYLPTRMYMLYIIYMYIHVYINVCINMYIYIKNCYEVY